MRYVYQFECWARHLRGHSFGFLGLRKLAKEMAKALEMQNGIFGTFIYENNGN